MLMNSDEIKSLGLIEDGIDQMYRGASYDLRVGKIIRLRSGNASDANELLEEAENMSVPPLGIVKVFSMEQVKIPRYITGNATVKTTLSNRGVLAINIGLLDPTYDGLVSSILINFGKNPVYVSKGTEFLRVTFHRINEPKEVPPPNNKATTEKYLARAKQEFVEKFSPTFLNIEENTRYFVNKVMRNTILTWVGAIALGLAGLTFLLNWGNVAVAAHYAQRSAAQQVQSVTARELDQLRNDSAHNVAQMKTESATQNAELQARIATLEKQVASLESRLPKGK